MRDDSTAATGSTGQQRNRFILSMIAVAVAGLAVGFALGAWFIL